MSRLIGGRSGGAARGAPVVPAALVLLALAGGAALAAEPALPPDDAYCRVNAAGQLSVAGHRIRFWGAIGGFPGKRETIKEDPYYRQKEAIRRVKRVGFNMFRIWHLEFDDGAKKGDLSATDVSDFFLAECARQGVRLWAAGFGGGRLYEDEVDVAAKALAGMTYRMIDFNERPLAEGKVPADGLLRIPADKPVWVTELSRP